MTEAEKALRLIGEGAGYVIVPREPTSEMHEAAWLAGLAPNDPMPADFPEINARIYRAMLAAAPPAPAGVSRDTRVRHAQTVAQCISAASIGHGHVFPRPDGVKARCGGPGICPQCSKDLQVQRRWVEMHAKAGNDIKGGGE